MIPLEEYQKEQENFFQELSESLPENETEAWITSVKIENVSPNEVIFSGFNKFFCDYVKKNHKNTIKELLRKHFQDVLADDFSVLLKLKKKKNTDFLINDGSFPDIRITGIISEHSFDTFVNGGNTHIAYAASLSVADNIDETKYNPLFICGDVGLGKTHLMQAIGLRVLQRHTQKKVLYCTSEKFTNDVIESIRFRKTEKNREKYRNLDVLLIDDIQFFENKESTQEEFFHTFNELVTHNKQVVITADRYPREIQNLEERLISRFSAGMVTKVEPPDFETRIAIIQNILDQMDLTVSDEVIEHIAHAVKSNVRDIKGMLIKLEAEHSLLNQEITLEAARIILKDVLNLDKSPKTMDEIIGLVSKRMNVKVADILSEKRDRNISTARQVAMYVSRDVTDCSFPVIGKKFDKNHTSVMQSCRKIKLLMEEQPEIKQMIFSIIRELTI